jgi:hypothetical protein
MLSCMLERDARDPLSAILHAGGSPAPSAFRDPPKTDLAGLRIAATTDFGFAPTERAIAGHVQDQACKLRIGVP